MEKKQPLIEQIYESWEWLLREKLEAANDIVRRIHYEYKLGCAGRMKPEVYEKFMKAKLAQMLKEIGDASSNV
jgi:hypothetical protein